MDLNVFWGLAEFSGVEASGQDGRLERRTAAPAAVRARVPGTSALFRKVA
ncbi:hypothetical protein [Lentzea californiensis]|nr:hypothetical protein [Lentzea californiensis]MCR3752296.1 hypothetical protein [Lentzea californiensis]